MRKVLDGDTVEVVLGGDPARVRLAGIDAPEKGQWTLVGNVRAGDYARTCLGKLLKARSWSLELYGKDIYGRWLGDAWAQDRRLSVELLEAGCVSVYAWGRFSRREKGEFYRALERAKRSRIGLWKWGGFMRPYHYRKAHKKKKAHIRGPS